MPEQGGKTRRGEADVSSPRVCTIQALGGATGLCVCRDPYEGFTVITPTGSTGRTLEDVVVDNFKRKPPLRPAGFCGDIIATIVQRDLDMRHDGPGALHG